MPGKSFGERNPVPIGVIGTVIVLVLLLAALDISHLPFVSSGRGYQAIFTESGGLESGDKVQVAGIDVGSVSSVTLDGDRVRVGFSVTDDGVRLGTKTRARISTLTVLGERGLTLTSGGPGTLAVGSTIPDSLTDPPYDLTQALSTLSTTTQKIDVGRFADAMRQITAALKNTPSSVHTTVQAVSRISSTIASRDSEIGTLFSAADNVSTILDQRSAQITTLLGDGTKLLQVINARRAAITTLLGQATELARQLELLVKDNAKDFGPAFSELQKAIGLLTRNKSYLDQVLDQAGPFAGSLGESVSSGPFFQSFVANLTRPLELAGLGGN